MRIAVITGATQGIGLETARILVTEGYHVVLTGRRQEAVERGLAALERNDILEGHVLDVADQASVDAFFAWLRGTHDRIDVLVNNAGRTIGAQRSTVSNTSADAIAEAVNNNALGAWRMIQLALPMMNPRGYGRIVNVSSGMGALGDMGAGAVAYRVSKTALNAVTVIASKEAGTGVKINAVCPGWVRTDMGGPNATRSVSEGATGVVWAATLPTDGPNGGFFRDGKAIDW